MRRNELDNLTEELEAEARRRGIAIFPAQPIWDDENLITVHWQERETGHGWRAFFEVAEARNVSMLLLIAHSFHEGAFEPSPPSFRTSLDTETRIELEEQEQMLMAAREFSGQTGRIELGWIEGNVFYQWGHETDWYARVWELVMSRPYDASEDEEED